MSPVLQPGASPDIRRAATRGRQQAGWLDARFSFSFGDWRDPGRDGFGALLALNEDRIAPGAGFPMHPHRDVEILMLPLSGGIAHADSLGNAFEVGIDEALHMRAGSGILHSQMNASFSAIDHHLQIWLRPRTPELPPYAVRRVFLPQDRQDRWQLIASGDGRAGSLRIDVGARVWRATVQRRILPYLPAAGRSTYLHLARGEVALASVDAGPPHALRAGDGVAWIHAQPLCLSPVAGGVADVLLFDLPSLR